MYFLDEQFWLFVSALICLYWLAGHRARNLVLLAANIVWLVWFSWQTVAALGALTLLVVYPAATLGDRARVRGDQRRADAIAWVGVVVLIALASLLRLQDRWFSVVPDAIDGRFLRWIGFSYFLLKSIHAMRATARGIVPRASALQLLQFTLFLPTLSSGPIYRLDTFVEQLTAPKKLTWADLHDGFVRITYGLGKKVVFTQPLAKVATVLHGHKITMPGAYVVTYVMLFIDFSGYSDIAIGLGRLLGFQVPENFKHPFTATTLTQFWRNWHATLTDWQRENVFVPLGGMRAKGWKLSAIVLGSMLIVGIWHAFSLVFIGWGLYHGTLLLLEDRLGIKPLRAFRTPRWKLWLRYALVQAAVIGGMFAFM